MSFAFRKTVCCGTIFVGPFGEVMVDPRFLHKCSVHMKPKPEILNLSIDKVSLTASLEQVGE